MKNLLIAAILSLISSTAMANSLVGVWELVSGEYVNNEGNLVSYQDINLQSRKIISQSHFSFTSMKGKEFWASGSGKYSMENGKYVETLQHNSFGEQYGAEFKFDAKVEENFWYNSRWDGEKRVEYEVWRKVE